MVDITSTDILGMKAITAIRAIAGVKTTEAQAEEEWFDLLIAEQERVIEEYKRLKKTIH